MPAETEICQSHPEFHMGHLYTPNSIAVLNVVVNYCNNCSVKLDRFRTEKTLKICLSVQPFGSVHKTCFKFASGGDSDLTTVLCSVIRAKVKCITTYAPICLTPERVDVMRFNYLAEEVEKARNNSNFLGYSFINTCPELTNFQSEYILYGYGSNKCSYQVLI
jgi:hypothetical protein